MSQKNAFQNGINRFSKIFNHFRQEAQDFVYLFSYDFVQISPACGPNAYQIMERLQTSYDTVSNGNIKCPIEKSIFAVNLLLKLFRATIANADTGILLSIHLNTYLFNMLAKFNQILRSKMYQILSFLTKICVF